MTAGNYFQESCFQCFLTISLVILLKKCWPGWNPAHTPSLVCEADYLNKHQSSCTSLKEKKSPNNKQTATSRLRFLKWATWPHSSHRYFQTRLHIIYIRALLCLNCFFYRCGCILPPADLTLYPWSLYTTDIKVPGHYVYKVIQVITILKMLVPISQLTLLSPPWISKYISKHISIIALT